MDTLSGGRTRTFPYIECVFPKSFEGEPVAGMPLEIKSIVNGGLDVQEALGRPGDLKRRCFRSRRRTG